MVDSDESVETDPKQLCTSCDYDCTSTVDLSMHYNNHHPNQILVEDCESILVDEVQELSAVSDAEVQEWEGSVTPEITSKLT